MQQYIDAHVHLWDLYNNINSWVINGSDENLKHNFLLNNYVSDVPKPECIVTIEASDGSKTISEVQWVNSIMLNNPENIKFKHIAYINMLQSPLLFKKDLSKFNPYKFISGFRHIMSYSSLSQYSPCETDFTVNKILLDNLHQNLLLLSDCDYIFNCQMYPGQLIKIRDIVIDSQVKCVIDHCGLPIMENYLIWLEMLAMYNHSKIYFKLSGFDINNNQKNYAAIVSDILKNISDNNLIFGSNYPFSQELGYNLINNYLLRVAGPEITDKALHKNALNLFKF